MSLDSRRIRVLVRPRPILGSEPNDNALELHNHAQPDPATRHGKARVSVYTARSSKRANGRDNIPTERTDFEFDTVIDDNTSQSNLFDQHINPLVDCTLDGFNATVLAYGQTGSGKTYTISGGSRVSFQDRGIAPRAISAVFKRVRSANSDTSIAVRVSYLEIYKEQFYDLLGNQGISLGDQNEIFNSEDSQGGPVKISSSKELSKLRCNTEEEALQFLFHAEMNRVIASHQLNEASTRSHCIFTIHIEKTSKLTFSSSHGRFGSSEDECYPTTEYKTESSKINLVDLAGSERSSKTGSTGEVLKESLAINKSLTFLQQVVIALSDKSREHIPFRQSKLTRVLQDSLGGNCKTLMIACVWPEAKHHEQTIATLRFATQMRCIQNKPVVNRVQSGSNTKEVAHLKRYIQQLRDELAIHDQLVGINARAQADFDQGYDESQMTELDTMIETYTNDVTQNPPRVTSLKQVNALLELFRSKLITARSDQVRASQQPPVATQMPRSSLKSFPDGMQSNESLEITKNPQLAVEKNRMEPKQLSDTVENSIQQTNVQQPVATTARTTAQQPDIAVKATAGTATQSDIALETTAGTTTQQSDVAVEATEKTIAANSSHEASKSSSDKNSVLESTSETMPQKLLPPAPQKLENDMISNLGQSEHCSISKNPDCKNIVVEEKDTGRGPSDDLGISIKQSLNTKQASDSTQILTSSTNQSSASTLLSTSKVLTSETVKKASSRPAEPETDASPETDELPKPEISKLEHLESPRELAFAEFKNTQTGAELVLVRRSARHEYTAIRSKVKLAKAGINGSKREIDRIMQQLQDLLDRGTEQAAREMDQVQNNNNFDVEETRVKLTQSLSCEKLKYKKRFSQLQELRKETMFAANRLATCEQEIASQFQSWYQQHKNGLIKSVPLRTEPSYSKVRQFETAHTRLPQVKGAQARDMSARSTAMPTRNQLELATPPPSSSYHAYESARNAAHRMRLGLQTQGTRRNANTRGRRLVMTASR